MIAIPLLVWYSTYKNKDVPTNGLVYPLGNVFFRIYARVGNVRSRPAPKEITGRSKKRMENFTERKAPAGLYDPRFEHDNCGIGAVVDIKGRKTHKRRYRPTMLSGTVLQATTLLGKETSKIRL